MKLAIEVRRDGELLGWYVTEVFADFSTGKHFTSSNGYDYAWSAIQTPLTRDPILVIETNDDNEEPMLLNENFVSIDSRAQIAELMAIAADEGLIDPDKYLPPAEPIQNEAGTEVRYVREVYSDTEILGILSHARRSLATRLNGADSGYDRVINHLIKASNYLEQCLPNEASSPAEAR